MTLKDALKMLRETGLYQIFLAGSHYVVCDDNSVVRGRMTPAELIRFAEQQTALQSYTM